MEGSSKVITLPGDQLFQAATISDLQAHFRPSILHAYGPNKRHGPCLPLAVSTTRMENSHAVFGVQSKNAPWQTVTWTPVGGFAIKSNISSTTVNANTQAALSLLWYRQTRSTTLPWDVPCFNGPLLPYETTSYYVNNQQQQADSALQHELADITTRELACYITTALPTCASNTVNKSCQICSPARWRQASSYIRPLTQEAQQLIALSLEPRQQVFSRLLTRYAVNSPTSTLIIDCPRIRRPSWRET